MKQKVWTVWTKYSSDETWFVEGSLPTRSRAKAARDELAAVYPLQEFIVRSIEVSLPKRRKLK